MTPPALASIQQLHRQYCQSTGQNLSLRFDRQRLWFDFLQAGFASEQLAQVIRYLQREIRQGRRNVGALKLSNLLQLDRFEEDLHISRVRLQPPTSVSRRPTPRPTDSSPAHQEQRRQQALRCLRQIKDNLGLR